MAIDYYQTGQFYNYLQNCAVYSLMDLDNLSTNWANVDYWKIAQYNIRKRYLRWNYDYLTSTIRHIKLEDFLMMGEL